MLSIVIMLHETIQQKTKEVKGKISGRIKRQNPFYIARYTPQQWTVDRRDYLQKESFKPKKLPKTGEKRVKINFILRQVKRASRNIAFSAYFENREQNRFKQFFSTKI